MKEILNYLSNTFWKLSEKSKNYVLENCDEIFIPKGTTVLESGKVCRDVWFIKKGLLRASQPDPEKPDKEFTNWLMTENDIATSPPSFFREQISLEKIVAEEDTTAFRMSKKDLFAGLAKHHDLSMITTLVISNYYCNFYQQAVNLRMKSPQLIYEWILATCPELLARALQRDLASFLGVSEPIFRKIKKGEYKQPKDKSRKSKKSGPRKK